MRLPLVLVALLTLCTTTAAGEPTHLTIRVLAHDAKLIGDVAGGARITVRDATSDAILARGVQTGGTGSTDAIVREPWVRGDARFDTDGAAAFRTTLDLDRPTRIRIEAEGPLGFPGTTFSASRTLLAVPGAHLDGNGVVLTLQGLIVSTLAPHTEADLVAGASVRVRAGVKLLCTCPIEPDGLWDADDYSIRAELWRAGTMVASVPLDYDGKPNVFAADLPIPALGDEDTSIHELRLVAGNPATGNWGSTHTVFRVGR